MYLTYFMINWRDAEQSRAEEHCMQCSRQMSKLEVLVGKENLIYAGLVCHNCKRVLWVKSG